MQNQTYESNFLFPRRMLFFHANRSALLIRGLVFFILGLIGLFRPIGSLAAVTVILGIYGIVVVALITSIIVNFYNEIKHEDDEKDATPQPAQIETVNKEDDKAK